jgi:alpha-1,4-digalacturonate transport system substrate-binding protein
MSGSWHIAGLADNAHFAWQAGPTPRGTVASSIYGGDYIVAFNTSQHLPEAIDFIKWVTSPDIQAQYAKTFGMIPANLKAAAVKYDNPAATDAIKAMQAELNASPAYAATDQAWPQMQAVWGAVKTAVTQAVAGQISSAEAISQIKKAADASLEAGK